VEEIVARAGRFVGVSYQETAKLRFGGQDLFQVLGVFEQSPRIAEHIVGQPEVSGVVHLAAGEGVIAQREIGGVFLRADMNFDAIMHPMQMLSDVGEDQKVRAIANLDLEPFAEKMVKKIVRFQKSRLEVTEINSHFHHKTSSPRVNQAIKGVHPRSE
jgi:hypothetical protein